MLNQKAKEILELFLLFTANQWKKEIMRETGLINKDYEIKYLLGRQKFYRKNILPPEINELIEETIWRDFLEEEILHPTYDNPNLAVQILEGSVRVRKVRDIKIERLIKEISKVRKNYLSLVFQITEQEPLSDSLKWYQEKIETTSTNNNDQDWVLLTELEELAKKEVYEEQKFEWFSIFNNYFHLLADTDKKRKLFARGEITHEEWEETVSKRQQDIEKLRRVCREKKQWKIEEYIQRIAADYLRKHPNSSYSQEKVIIEVLGKDWRNKINQDQISNIENEKRDYETLFVKGSERFQKERLIEVLHLIEPVCILLFSFLFYLHAKQSDKSLLRKARNPRKEDERKKKNNSTKVVI
jgi:hypothetical protein